MEVLKSKLGAFDHIVIRAAALSLRSQSAVYCDTPHVSKLHLIQYKLQEQRHVVYVFVRCFMWDCHDALSQM